MFAKPRTYTLDITVQLSRNVTAYGGNFTAYGSPKFYLDGVNCVLFGNSFGLLGSDDLARDIFTQLIVGTQISFVIGIISAVLSVGIGLLVGLAAGYIGGATDEVLMRLNDMLLVIPSLPLTIVLVFVLGPKMINIIIIVGLLGWMGFARTVRSAVLSLKERSFIEAVKSAGGGRGYIIRRHIVPNVFPLVYITLAMAVPGAIVTEAALSFLGLGPLDVMSWGRILRESEGAGTVAINAFGQWYWTIPPGICIALLSLSFVLIGYALDEILNPRLRER
jgi:peptide/nickel transport system permease protein